MFFHFVDRVEWFKFLVWLSHQLTPEEVKRLRKTDISWFYVSMVGTQCLTYGQPTDTLEILADDGDVICKVSCKTPTLGDSYNDRVEIHVEQEDGIPISCDLDGLVTHEGDKS